VNVDLARSPIPSPGRNNEGNNNAGHPLEEHQFREELIGLPEDLPAVLLE
jgi:hypothetical protein